MKLNLIEELNALEYLDSKGVEQTYFETLTLDGLNDIIRKATYYKRNIERTNRTQRIQEVAQNLSIGDIVTVTGSKFIGEIWEVKKLNPKKVKCKRENGEIWNIPYAHILTS